MSTNEIRNDHTAHTMTAGEAAVRAVRESLTVALPAVI